MSDTRSLGRLIGKAETKLKNLARAEDAAIIGVTERYTVKVGAYFDTLPAAVQRVLVEGGAYKERRAPETQASA
jgi:hypothetical protein